MNAIYNNLENSNTSNPDRLLLNLTHEIDLQRAAKKMCYQNLVSTIHKISALTSNDKFWLLDDLILY